MHALFSMLAAYNGLGQHATSLTPLQLAKATLLELIAQTFCVFDIACIKYTITGFQSTIFTIKPYRKLYRYVAWPLIHIIAVISLMVAITDFIQCISAPAAWKYKTVPPDCISDYRHTDLAITLSGLAHVTYLKGLCSFRIIISTIADIILTILPTLALYRLHKPPEAKRRTYILLVAGGCSYGFHFSLIVNMFTEK